MHGYLGFEAIKLMSERLAKQNTKPFPKEWQN
jgi:hypothetical protein